MERPELLSEIAMETLDLFADNLVVEDRRTGGFNFGVLDKSAFFGTVVAGYDVGSTPMLYVFDGVVAVRGDRLALVKMQHDYGGEFSVPSLHLIQSSVDGRWERIALFDPDDTALAQALLDEWHSEIGDRGAG